MTKVSTDPIADMLSRVRNAIAVNKSEISLTHSNVKESVARLLKENGFVDDVKVESDRIGKVMRVVINEPMTNARISEVTRLSKPGKRLYTKAEKIPVIKRGRGVVINSTTKGIMTGDQARKQGIGGELICKVY